MSKTTPLTNKGTAGQIWYIHRDSQVQIQIQKKQCQCQRKQKEKKPICTLKSNGCKCRKIKKLFFSPRCKLCLSPSCPSPSRSVLLNKCKQQGGLGGMSVTKSNGSLQILQARLTWSRQERRLKDTRCTLPTCSRSLPPSVCFFLRIVSTYTDDNAVGWHNTAMVKLWFWLLQNISGLLRPDCEQRKGGESYTTHCCREFRGRVNLFCDISNPLSPPLFSVLSFPHLHVCFSPAVLSFCHQCLHFEPNSINLSGNLQMFWVNYVNDKEIKTAKKFSLYFIIHHAPTSSPNKLDLLSSPAHSGSKSSKICLRILITLCLHRN